MKYAISRHSLTVGTIILSDRIYDNREDAEKRCWELANEAKNRMTNANHISEKDITMGKTDDGIVWVKFRNKGSNMYEVVELEEH